MVLMEQLSFNSCGVTVRVVPDYNARLCYKLHFTKLTNHLSYSFLNRLYHLLL